MELRQTGYITHGKYIGGEWDESTTWIEITSKTPEGLAIERLEIENQYNSNGTTIDFGFTSNVKKVSWGAIYSQELFGKLQN